MAELTRAEIFKARNDRHRSIKEMEGETILPVAWHTHNYVDAHGKQHNVLVIKDGKTGEMFKTEVLAFIDKFDSYIEAFGVLDDAEKPLIRITSKVSKANNKYFDFELVD